MKYLSDQKLLRMGIQEWGLRQKIMSSVANYFSTVAGVNISMPEVNSAFMSAKRRASYMDGPQASNLQPAKKPRLTPRKNRIKFKDIDQLVAEPAIPVDEQFSVHCTNSNLAPGKIIYNKQKKAVVEWMDQEGKKKTGTLPQFYRASTSQPLHAKGDSWKHLFFTNPHTGETRSLYDVKYYVEGPKKAVSAFLFFSKEIRESVGKSGIGQELKSEDFAKKSGEMWKQLPEEQKKKYRQLEKQDKNRFKDEKEKWLITTGQMNPDGTPKSLNDHVEDMNSSIPEVSAETLQVPEGSLGTGSLPLLT
eukprot:CAMPEP_0168531122 /NCGR_PEP_ID=MMETSP0405-20121227/15199_1 /TAXON_ID=498012 /ORGANISM="Trichosphaerium sp, Strain Am-I-7 wt" /LENGTH=304 /DNA_ID=CAMNT_0008555743 /DNA_START=591 /DNA_END=1505 /DNA_ORIENTATION=+